jgi:hypothetical protein
MKLKRVGIYFGLGPLRTRLSNQISLSLNDRMMKFIVRNFPDQVLSITNGGIEDILTQKLKNEA